MLGTHVSRQKLRIFSLNIYTSSKYLHMRCLQRLRHFPSLNAKSPKLELNTKYHKCNVVNILFQTTSAAITMPFFLRAGWTEYKTEHPKGQSDIHSFHYIHILLFSPEALL